MRQETALIYKFTAALLALGLVASACMSPPKPKKSPPPQRMVFTYKYDRVWRAAQLALAKYPIRVNDMDSGVLETDYIRGEMAWVSPPKTRKPPGGYRYKISVRMVKGWHKKTMAPIVKVTVLKQAEYQKNFFSAFEKTLSDGLEEKSLLYRMGRELKIEKALSKVKSN
jgi:hypothetical protein